jgi:hypothetical protein
LRYCIIVIYSDRKLYYDIKLKYKLILKYIIIEIIYNCNIYEDIKL